MTSLSPRPLSSLSNRGDPTPVVDAPERAMRARAAGLLTAAQNAESGTRLGMTPTSHVLLVLSEGAEDPSAHDTAPTGRGRT